MLEILKESLYIYQP